MGLGNLHKCPPLPGGRHRCLARIRAGLCATLLGSLCIAPQAVALMLNLNAYPHGTVMSNQLAASQGVTLSAENDGGGPDLTVIFDTRQTGTADPDLEGPPNTFWDGGNIASNANVSNLLIVAENSTDANTDGILDDPDDEAGGGKIFFDLASNGVEVAFNFIDFEVTADQFIHFTDGSTTVSVEFTEFTDTNSTFYTPGLVVGDHTANFFEPLNMAQVPELEFFTRFWFELPESGSINGIFLIYAGSSEIGSIGDYVWFDSDGEGDQDPGETGFTNVSVALYIDRNTNGIIDGPDGNAQDVVNTDANGYYIFTNRSENTYLVQVTDTNNILQGFGLTGGTNPHSVALSSGQNYTNADFGYNQLPGLGDFVWFDTDQDGIQDVGETGVEGVAVTLYDASSNVVLTTNTDVNGEYGFFDLSTGTTYFVGFTLPSGYTFSPANVGAMIRLIVMRTRTAAMRRQQPLPRMNFKVRGMPACTLYPAWATSFGTMPIRTVFRMWVKRASLTSS